MSPAARSLQVFGMYLLALSAALVVAPNLLLGLFGVAPTQEIWIRVLGLLVGILGAYYLVAAVRALVPLFLPTVIGRATVFLVFLAFVLLGMAPWQLFLFGVVDLVGALWTWRAMRAEAA